MLTARDALDLSQSEVALKQRLAAGLDPNARDRSGDTIMHWALRVGSPAARKVVTLLLARRGIDLAATNKKGDSLLGAAMIGTHLDLMQQLLDRGVKLSKTENPVKRIAQNYSSAKDYAAAKFLLDHELVDQARLLEALVVAKQNKDKKLIKMLGGEAPPKPKTTPRPKTKAPPRLTIDKKKLTTAKAREKALDALGTWFVAALLAAGRDRKSASDVITHAIRSFYDVRESAKQERGEYAGHFFMVDAVGLGDTERPVPWNVLEKQATETELALWQKLFDTIEAKVD